MSTSYGLSYTDREGTGPDPAKDDTFAGLRANAIFRQRLGAITVLDHDSTVNRSLERSSDYSVNLTNALTVELTSHLSLRLAVQFLYENETALEDAEIIGRVRLLDPDGIPRSGDELFETVADGGTTIGLGRGRLRKDRLDTIFRTALVIGF